MPIPKAELPTTWRWQRWIPAAQEPLWAERLEACPEFPFSWSLAQRPRRVQLELSAYLENHATAAALAQRFGGKVTAQKAESWIQQRPAPPLAIGKKLLVVHGEIASKTDFPPDKILHIPQGLAFGSGEHSTTFMLLRALAKQKDLPSQRVLDLGTGSGILALASRRFGASKIIATDFDTEAIRTARENERLNFLDSTIMWRVADVRKGKPWRADFDLVLANLFSGILIEAAPSVLAAVKPGGELWLSGILRDQEAEVAQAYRRLGARILAAQHRRKWSFLALTKPAAKGSVSARRRSEK